MKILSALAALAIAATEAAEFGFGGGFGDGFFGRSSFGPQRRGGYGGYGSYGGHGGYS